MATPDTTRPTRRALLAGAAATLPSTVVLAAPAVILPRPGLAAALTEHVDGIAATVAPFAARRGADGWTFNVANRETKAAADLTLIYLSDDLNRFGERDYERMEVFRPFRDGIFYSCFRGGQNDVFRAHMDFDL